ncbi:MAG: hypothetical protein O8C64_04700 [Candidatus Methanoperedens sp.]|nr:hypothetical protein [Candidatus Methanoperedens sp.]MCZ7404320.1 hypothetical protein [Candidatus Methanoperedens sp.]
MKTLLLITVFILLVSGCVEQARSKLSMDDLFLNENEVPVDWKITVDKIATSSELMEYQKTIGQNLTGMAWRYYSANGTTVDLNYMVFASNEIARNTAQGMQNGIDQNRWKWKQVRAYENIVVEIIDEKGLDNPSADSEYDDNAAQMLDKKYEGRKK